MKTTLLLTALSCLLCRIAAAETKVSAVVSVGNAPASAAPIDAKRKGKGPPPWAPAHGYRAKYAYQYFPAQEVYHRPSDGVWFYFENGRWSAGARLPVGLKVDVKAAVPVEMDSEKPFAFHGHVKTAFPKPVDSHGNQAAIGSEPGKPRGKGKGRN